MRNPAVYIKTHISVSTPPQCRFQSVMYVRPKRMYLESRFFLVFTYFQYSNSLQDLCETKTNVENIKNDLQDEIVSKALFLTLFGGFVNDYLFVISSKDY